MEEVPYQNREIREMFEDVQDSLTRIEKQTTQTNGRVSKLENWRWFVAGGLTIITVVLLPVVFIIIQLYLTTSSLR